VLPEPVEPGERRLPRRQRVALDLHVEKELRHDAEDSSPEEDQTRLRGDEGPDDELPGRQANASGDDAGADDAPEVSRRFGKIADDERLEWHKKG
jgi:hypothetical protein